MTTDPQTAVDRIPYCTKIRYGVTGAPILTEDEMDGTYAPGVGIRPTLIELIYRPARDGKHASVDASVTGTWTRFGKPDPDGFGGQVATHFKNGPDGWPAWLAAEARLHDPADVSSPPPDQTLRDRIAEAVRYYPGCTPLTDGACYRIADAVLGVLPPPADRAAEVEPPLSPDYSHEACGFHWHGRDGMDIPMRDGQPVCPRCELAKVQKHLDHRERRCEELRIESRRRGKNVLEQAEKIQRLEKQLGEVRTQLGAEILRAGQAEATLERIREVVGRLANHAVGFQDVLDDSDRGPWAKTVGADIAELRRLAAETQQQPETPAPCSTPPCDGDDLCAAHEEAQAHAEGEHAFCGPTCEVEFPSDKLRNTILHRALPGSAGMLDELLRRAGARQQADTETQAHPPSHAWKVESPRRENWASWGATHDERVWAAASYEDVIAVAPQRPFRLVRATTTYVVEAEHTPPAVPVQPAAADNSKEPRP